MTTAPLVGEPVAFGIGFVVLVAYAFAKSWTEDSSPGIVLLTVALLWANNWLARAVTAPGLAGVLWVAIAGGPRTQAAVAFALVWLLLIGGVAQAGRATTAAFSITTSR